MPTAFDRGATTALPTYAASSFNQGQLTSSYKRSAPVDHRPVHKGGDGNLIKVKDQVYVQLAGTRLPIYDAHSFNKNELKSTYAGESPTVYVSTPAYREQVLHEHVEIGSAEPAKDDKLHIPVGFDARVKALKAKGYSEAFIADFLRGLQYGSRARLTKTQSYLFDELIKHHVRPTPVAPAAPAAPATPLPTRPISMPALEPVPRTPEKPSKPRPSPIPFNLPPSTEKIVRALSRVKGESAEKFAAIAEHALAKMDVDTVNEKLQGILDRAVVKEESKEEEKKEFIPPMVDADYLDAASPMELVAELFNDFKRKFPNKKANPNAFIRYGNKKIAPTGEILQRIAEGEFELDTKTYTVRRPKWRKR